jgi:TrmH family RNA methyltransferase
LYPPERLAKLAPSHRLRKAALLLAGVERDLLGGGAKAASALEYGRALASWLAGDPATPKTLRILATAAARCDDQEGETGLRSLDALRHSLMRESGQAPADWDLLDPETGKEASARNYLPGIRAWFEDIRSPFNVGSMLRSAEAFGLEEVIISPASADPAHPRALRSAMGADRLIPWRRGGIEVLGEFGPAFALELVGGPIDEFAFPERGIVVLGSEELGVSRPALAACSLGSVRIPMRGAKASINVGVAFGILLERWTSRLRRADYRL